MPPPRLPRLAKYAGAVDIRVAVHDAEAHELRLLESRNQLQHSRLLAPLQLRLKANQAEVIAGQVVLAQLHRRIGRASGSRVDEPDRFHRSETQGVSPTVRHDLDRQASFADSLLVQIV